MTSIDVGSGVAGSGIPEFELDLPAGWRRHEVDDQSLQWMLSTARKRCMENHQPDLFAQLKPMLESTFDDMRKGNVFAYFCPTDPGDSTVAIPVSINASIRKPEAGQSLDDLVRMMVAHHGAQPLLGDQRTVRLERERELGSEEGRVVNHSVVYLTPVPGSRRTRALQLVAAFPRDPESSASARETEAIRALIDACVATLRWKRVAAPETVGAG